MGSFHCCFMSSINICQLLIDWFSQHLALGLTRALRSSISKSGTQDRWGPLPLLSHFGNWEGPVNSIASCNLSSVQLRIKTKGKAAREQNVTITTNQRDVGACQIAGAEGQKRLGFPAQVQAVLGYCLEQPLSFLVESRRGPCSLLADWLLRQAEAEFYLTIEFLGFVHKYVTPRRALGRRKWGDGEKPGH